MMNSREPTFEEPANVAALVDAAMAHAMAMRRPPESTYRLQLHKDFNFSHAAAIVPYLAQLGITHVYTSSYLQAVPGSTHGYDVIDHTRLNREIGSDADYQQFLDTLAASGMTHILDTVPNHVGVGTNENAWWNDVLENGPAAEHAAFFDIDWDFSARPACAGKVLLPILGKPYGDSLAGGDIKLGFDAGAGRFTIDVFDRRLPVAAASYPAILKALSARLSPTEAATLDQIASTSPANDSAGFAEKIAAAVRTNAELEAAIRKNLPFIAGDSNYSWLHELLERQHYRLASWRVGPDEINYRRFFAINDLAGLSMERQEVFDAAHSFILPRLAAGAIAGLRIDHPDGLSDPLEYFRRLQSGFVLAVARRLFGGEERAWQAVRQNAAQEIDAQLAARHNGPPPLYVVIEKILAFAEPMPMSWPIDGTSGYDFLIMINGLFVDAAAQDRMTSTYRDFIGAQSEYAELVIRNKLNVLRELLPSEAGRLAKLLDQIAQRHDATRDFTLTALRVALAEVIAAFPVYRTYITGPDIEDEDRAALTNAIEDAVARNPRSPREIFDFIRRVLMQELSADATPADRAAAVTFARRFQQLTAPATAKGIEDTTFYQYQRLISLNEVGGEPSKFGIFPRELHDYLLDRQKRYPYALSTLSTHDTKRSEDVRARISVLADVPELWRQTVNEWSDLNGQWRGETNGLPSPARDEEYCYYQSLLGAWPIECEGGVADEKFMERMQAFMLKANREANSRTSWNAPDAAHEAAVKRFVDATLDPARSAAFLESFARFQKKIAHFGRLASMSQTVLKLTAPGAADTYQGTELWDLSLVDPDNRRPVDYARRAEALQSLASADVDALFADTPDGRAKLLLHQRVLSMRKQHAGLFSQGDYLPLKITGPAAEHVFAFARAKGDVRAVVVVTKNLAKLAGFDTHLQFDAAVWKGTEIAFSLAGEWIDAISRQRAAPSAKVADLLRGRPVALWMTQ